MSTHASNAFVSAIDMSGLLADKSEGTASCCSVALEDDDGADDGDAEAACTRANSRSTAARPSSSESFSGPLSFLEKDANFPDFREFEGLRATLSLLVEACDTRTRSTE